MNVFLMSSERTGSNLLRVIFDAHSQFCAPTPPHILDKIVPDIAHYGDLAIFDNHQQLLNDMRRLVDGQLGQWHIDESEWQRLLEKKYSGFQDVFSAVYHAEARKRGKRHVFVKDNGVIRNPHTISILFPEAKYIYLIRDPRDVVLSWRKSASHYGSVADAARVWSGEQAIAMNFYAIHEKRNEMIKVIRYEDLVTNTERVSHELCEFLGVDFDESMLDYFKTDESEKSSRVVRDWRNLSSPIIKNNFAKYKIHLSRKDIDVIEHISSNEMDMLGYARENPDNRRGEYFNAAKIIRVSLTLLRLLLSTKTTIREKKERLIRLMTLKKMRDSDRSIYRWFNHDS